MLQAIAFVWPASAIAARLHTPQPIPPVDDDDDDDEDGDGGGSGGGNIDPDDDEGWSDDDEDEDDDTLWTAFRRRWLPAQPAEALVEVRCRRRQRSTP